MVGGQQQNKRADEKDGSGIGYPTNDAIAAA
jgi:hypothetical protein